MKSFSQIFESKEKISVNQNAINYISKSDLETYLNIAKPFLSESSRMIIDYLIVNNSTYIHELSSDNEENALAGFYNSGRPSKENLKNLWDELNKVIKSGRILEIPVFQTKEQFDSIINKEVSADEIILDLKTEKGRTKVVNQYMPLLHKLARQYNGKSNLSYEDLISAGMVGLTYAMNGYGKRNMSTVDDETIRNYTFGQYAAYFIRIQILESIKHESKTVREPLSYQTKERKANGVNRKNNTVSGDKTVGHDSEGGKTIFDFMGSVEDAGKSINYEDLKKLWDSFYAELKKEFDDKMLDIFYSSYGLNGYEKLKNKDIAKKYNVNPSNITYYISKIRRFCSTNKNIKKKLSDCYELMKECKSEFDNDNSLYSNSVRVDMNNKNVSIEE